MKWLYNTRVLLYYTRLFQVRCTRVCWIHIDIQINSTQYDATAPSANLSTSSHNMSYICHRRLRVFNRNRSIIVSASLDFCYPALNKASAKKKLRQGWREDQFARTFTKSSWLSTRLMIMMLKSTGRRLDWMWTVKDRKKKLIDDSYLFRKEHSCRTSVSGLSGFQSQFKNNKGERGERILGDGTKDGWLSPIRSCKSVRFDTDLGASSKEMNEALLSRSIVW